MRTAIVTDSTAYIPKEIQERLNIFVLPLSVQIDGQSLLEEVELPPGRFYQLLKNSTAFPTSSQPAVGEIFKLFSRLSEEYDAIISIHLSSGISGTFQTVFSLKDEFKNCRVFPYDSEISCYPQARLVFEAVRLAGQGISPEEILLELDELKAKTSAYFVVDDLMNLQRGGRLSGGAAMIGSVMKIKPILRFQDKQIVVYEKIRTQTKALKRIEDLLHQTVDSVDYPLIATVIHANTEEKARGWKAVLEDRFPDVRFELSYFGAVIGTHLGEGSLGLTWTHDTFTQSATKSARK